MNEPNNSPYFKELKQTQVLSRQEEEALYPYLANQDIRNQLVTANLRLAIKNARKYSRMYSASFDDLIGEANVGLMEAAKRFDPTRGFRFNTYAEHWIRKHIKSFISSNSIIVSRNHDHFYQSNTVRRLLNDGLSREAICERMKISSRTLSKIETQYIGEKQASDENILFELDQYEDHEESIYLEELGKQILEKCDSLSNVERSCMEALYGLNHADTLTTGELAKQLGKTTASINKLRARTIVKLRNKLEPQL